MKHATQHQISHRESLDFILGGNAYVTFRNTESGGRYTYRVKKHKISDVYFVSVMYGSDNTSDYKYIGCIFQHNLFKTTTNSTLPSNDVRVRGFEYVFKHLLADTLDSRMEIWHEGRCARCGRILTVPESIANGFGPECIKLRKIA